jgi:DNA-directed RNA polymerase specialized sigma24 family protein
VDTFEEFVAARRPELLRTALLLAGDRAGAEELVQRALTRSRRRAGDPLAAARAALVTGSTRRQVRGEQVIESLPDPFAPAAAGPEPLARALRDLPARTRAATVLTAFDRLPLTEVAALLGCPVETAAQEADRGTRALSGVLAPDLYARPGSATRTPTGGSTTSSPGSPAGPAAGGWTPGKRSPTSRTGAAAPAGRQRPPRCWPCCACAARGSH